MKNIKQKLSFGLTGLLLMGTFLATPSAYAQTATNTDTVIQFVNTMQSGQRGDLVKILQAILAKDPTILDQKYITGYFGPMTKAAVKKYQKKNGLSQVGAVGPKTLALINAELSKQPVAASTTTTETGAVTNCVKVPPGHLIAPGFIKKNGQVQAPACMVLPPGIAKKIGTNWNSGKDTTAPILTLGAVSGLSTTGATINFTANEPVVFEVLYGTTVSYGSTTTKTTTAATVNAQALTGLTANTPYFYQVKVYDGSNNTSNTTGTFTTLAVADTTVPVISGVTVNAITATGATIAWTTNENASTKVYVSATTPVNKATASTIVTGPTSVTAHSVTISGLTAGTQYYFLIESVDSASNMATSAETSFTTTTI